MPPTSLDRYRGCLLAGAAGDALGAAVEFDSVEAIRARFGPGGIQDPAEAYGRVGAITDDTQMTLFTGEALLQAADRLDRGIGNPAMHLWWAYQRWLATQGVAPQQDMPEQLGNGELHCIPELQARRAPGNTCLSALQEPSGPIEFRARNRSKGCGGVMRAAPCGLIGNWGLNGRFRLGVTAAAMTHGHPSGHLAAGALAHMVGELVAERPLGEAVASALDVLRQEPDSGEVVDALERARALERPDVAALGEGWVAEEALAIAVHCALQHPTDLAAALRLAANHSGDSDSTAAIAGNLMGAHLGVDAIPPRWLEALELRETIDRLATALHGRLRERRRDVDWRRWGSG